MQIEVTLSSTFQMFRSHLIVTRQQCVKSTVQSSHCDSAYRSLPIIIELLTGHDSELEAVTCRPLRLSLIHGSTQTATDTHACLTFDRSRALQLPCRRSCIAYGHANFLWVRSSPKHLADALATTVASLRKKNDNKDPR